MNTYKLYLTDGRWFVFADYEYMKAWWHAHAKTGLLDYIEVIDPE